MTSEGNLLPCSVCQASPTDTCISQIVLTPTPAEIFHTHDCLERIECKEACLGQRCRRGRGQLATETQIQIR